MKHYLPRSPFLAVASLSILSFILFSSMGDALAHGTKTHKPVMEMGQNMKMMHNHQKWISPPKPYKGMHNTKWNDPDEIVAGKLIYEDYCVSCHGSDGFGTGLMAEELEHKPANMNHHFHISPGKGDDYLFWRVSEGGSVEPFKSTNSSMPGFKDILTNGERWSVLSYIHNVFHKRFKSNAN